MADSANNAIRAVTLATGAVVTLAGGGSAALWLGAAAADGVGAAATLAAPSGLAWLPDEGVLLVAEAGGNRLRTLNVTVRASTVIAFAHPCASQSLQLTLRLRRVGR